MPAVDNCQLQQACEISVIRLARRYCVNKSIAAPYYNDHDTNLGSIQTANVS